MRSCAAYVAHVTCATHAPHVTCVAHVTHATHVTHVTLRYTRDLQTCEAKLAECDGLINEFRQVSAPAFDEGDGEWALRL